MVDDVLALHRVREDIGLVDGGPFQMDFPRRIGEIPKSPGRQVIDDRDLVPGSEAVHEMGPDEARAAGDEDALLFHDPRRTEGGRHKRSGGLTVRAGDHSFRPARCRLTS